VIAKKQFTIHQLLNTKDTEKVLKEELSKHFEGQSQRLRMLTKGCKKNAKAHIYWVSDKTKFEETKLKNQM
jgi:hypothetical protein